jgi:hypothetical protein
VTSIDLSFNRLSPEAHDTLSTLMGVRVDVRYNVNEQLVPSERMHTNTALERLRTVSMST